MELEGEQRIAASIRDSALILRSAEPDQGVSKSRRAGILGKPAVRGQGHGGLVERNGARTLGLVVDILQADPCLDPDRQIVVCQIVVRAPMADVIFQGSFDRRGESGEFAVPALGRVGHTAECFRNDRVRSDTGAEDFRGNSGHRGILFLRVAFARHGRGRAYADWGMLRIADSRLETTHQHRHIRALAATIGVQLIQYDKLQAAAVFDDLPIQIILPRHE